MFVGHYGIALAVKATEPRSSLGMLFVAAQAADIAMSLLLLFGVGQVSVSPGGRGPTAVSLSGIAISHGLPATLLAAVAGWWITRRYAHLFGVPGNRFPVLVAVVLMSHWVLDVLADREVPLLSGTIGLGLAGAAATEFWVETGVLLAGACWYWRGTGHRRVRSVIGRFAMPSFVAGLIAFQAVTSFGTPPAGQMLFAVANLAAYQVLAILAGHVDRWTTGSVGDDGTPAPHCGDDAVRTVGG